MAAYDYPQSLPEAYRWRKYGHKRLAKSDVKRYYYHCSEKASTGCPARLIVDKAPKPGSVPAHKATRATSFSLAPAGLRGAASGPSHCKVEHTDSDAQTAVAVSMSPGEEHRDDYDEQQHNSSDEQEEQGALAPTDVRCEGLHNHAPRGNASNSRWSPVSQAIASDRSQAASASHSVGVCMPVDSEVSDAAIELLRASLANISAFKLRSCGSASQFRVSSGSIAREVDPTVTPSHSAKRTRLHQSHGDPQTNTTQAASGVCLGSGSDGQLADLLASTPVRGSWSAGSGSGCISRLQELLVSAAAQTAVNNSDAVTAPTSATVTVACSPPSLEALTPCSASVTSTSLVTSTPASAWGSPSIDCTDSTWKQQQQQHLNGIAVASLQLNDGGKYAHTAAAGAALDRCAKPDAMQSPLAPSSDGSTNGSFHLSQTSQWPVRQVPVLQGMPSWSLARKLSPEKRRILFQQLQQQQQPPQPQQQKQQAEKPNMKVAELVAELLRMQQHGRSWCQRQQLSSSAPVSPVTSEARGSVTVGGTLGSEALRGRKREDSHLKPLSLPGGLLDAAQQFTAAASGSSGDNRKRKAKIIDTEGRELVAPSNGSHQPLSDSSLIGARQPVELDLLACFSS